MEQIPSKVNPRDYFPQHRERGPKRFEYTYADLADALGMTEVAVRQAVSRGKFDPHSLPSICHFWAHHRRTDDHVVVVPLKGPKPTPEKVSLTTKQAHDTVGSVSEVPVVSLVGE